VLSIGYPAPVRTIRRARTHRHAGYGTEPAVAARAGRAHQPIRLIWSASRPSAGLRPERLNGASCAARTIGPRPTSLLVLFALAQRGAFAPDGIIATLVPVTTVVWILAVAATLPRSWRAATGASAEAPG
jgi:hypothetical protein